MAMMSVISYPTPSVSPAIKSPPSILPTGRPALRIASHVANRRFRVAALPKDESMSSFIKELEREQLPPQLEEAAEEAAELLDEGLAARWRELHGSDQWAGLLDPMDPLLRQELIRYGEFTQCCYDGYDFDPYSRYCGSCKYPRRSFFAELGMESAGYEVTRYLYATSDLNFPNFFKQSNWSKAWSERANWIGYVAVSGDEATARLGRRDVVVAWRGTVTKLEWLADLMDFLRPVTDLGIPCPDPRVKVESGFLVLYTDKDPSCRFCKYSAREQVLSEVRRLVAQYTAAGEEVSVSFVGHSLGSALAMLSAYDVAETGADVGVGGQRAKLCVFSFAGPRVGNGRFKERFEDALGVRALRVVNVHDKVPKVPGVFFNERVPEFIKKVADALPWTYSHVGVELELDHKRSPFLKDTGDISAFHNLEAHLHLLDGYHGRGMKFEPATKRDPALVNKSANFLKDLQLVPPYWRQDYNKGMIRTSDGRWVQPERPKIDDHPSDMHTHLRQLGLNADN